MECESKVKHLEIIQGVIGRTAQNSFLLKGWTVTLAAAFFVIAAKDADVRIAIVAYIPACMFLGLDSYYLWQERLFRDLYDHVRSLAPMEIDFSMRTSGFKNDQKYLNALFSASILCFYVPILVVICLATMVVG